MGYVKLGFFLSLIAQMAFCAELKKIEKAAPPASPHWVGDGFRVFNYFPGQGASFEDLSPFILLDYSAPYLFPPTKVQRGVGAHPHRGFETVTLVYEGVIAHRDSQGGSGTIGPGDVQWMTAGSGILHEEFHEKNFAKKGGRLHGVQLWVNLPKKEKMSSPKYQTLLSQDMGRYKIDDKGSILRVIAGKFNGVKGPASTFTPMELYDVDLKKGSRLDLDLPEAHNSMLLMMQGAVTVNGQIKARAKDLIRFGHKGEKIEIAAQEKSFFLILSGEPIHEPVVQSGPFVMNTQSEIEEAERDFNSGKFGRL